MRPNIDRLEPRLCLAATLADGVLTVEGTAADDSVRLSRQGDQIVVRETTGTTAFDAGQVTQVVVNAGDGNDRIRLDRLGRRGQSGDIAAVVNGGAGDDRITGSRGDDVLSGGDGSDRIFGQSGDDEINGDAGNDLLSGDAGDDDLTGGDGSDRLDGGTGVDTAEASADVFTGVENFPGLPPGFVPDTDPRRPGFGTGGFGTGNFGTGGFGAGAFRSDDPRRARFGDGFDNFPRGTTVPVSGPAPFGNVATQPGVSAFPPDPAFGGFAAFPVEGGLIFVSSPVVPVSRIVPEEQTVGASTDDSPVFSSEASDRALFFDSDRGVFVLRTGATEVPVWRPHGR